MLENIVTNRQSSIMLVDLGIKPVSIIWSVWLDGSGWSVKAPINNLTYMSHRNIPAWTKEELDVMLGPDVPAPQLAADVDLHSTERDKKGSYFITFYPERRLLESGVQLSAWVLKMALEAGKVDAMDANKRYSKKFGG